jgi:hypothetical protein
MLGKEELWGKEWDDLLKEQWSSLLVWFFHKFSLSETLDPGFFRSSEIFLDSFVTTGMGGGKNV